MDSFREGVQLVLFILSDEHKAGRQAGEEYAGRKGIKQRDCKCPPYCSVVSVFEIFVDKCLDDSLTSRGHVIVKVKWYRFLSLWCGPLLWSAFIPIVVYLLQPLTVKSNL